MLGCPVEEPPCRVEVWQIDDSGGRVETRPERVFLSDMSGRLLSEEGSRDDDRLLVSYEDAAGPASGLAASNSRVDGGIDFVFEDGRVVAYIAAEDEVIRTFHYDDGGFLTSEWVVGWGTELRYTYDQQRVSSVEEWRTAETGVVYYGLRWEFQYDLDDCVTRIHEDISSMPEEGEDNHYTHSAGGQLQTVQDAWANRKYEYAFVGQCESLDSGLPTFRGVPYWLWRAGWPVGGCVTPTAGAR